MKYLYRTLFTVIVCVTPLLSLAQVPGDDPVEYNNQVVAEQKAIIQKNVDYMINSVHGRNERETEAKRRAVVDQLKKSIYRLRRLPAYKGDTKLKDEAVAVFELYYETYNKDFSEVNLLRKDRESSFEAMEKYIRTSEKAEKKLGDAGERFAKAQEEYAKKYELELKQTGSELQEKVRMIGKVNTYTREIFLHYFRVSKLHGIFMDHMEAKKSGPMESARKDMEKGCDEVLAQLRDMDAFLGEDKELRDVTIELVEYYRILASVAFKDLVNITDKNQNELTQDDVERYNSFVESYNTDFPAHMDAYNKAYAGFQKRHVPRN